MGFTISILAPNSTKLPSTINPTKYYQAPISSSSNSMNASKHGPERTPTSKPSHIHSLYRSESPTKATTHTEASEYYSKATKASNIETNSRLAVSLNKTKQRQKKSKKPKLARSQHIIRQKRANDIPKKMQFGILDRTKSNKRNDNKKMDEMEKNMNRMKTENEALKLKNASLIKKLDEMEMSIKIIKAENNALKVEKKAVNKKLEESKNRTGRSYDCLKILERECDALKAMNKKQKKKNGQLLDNIDEYEVKCKELETENASLRKDAYENDKELNEKLKKAKQKVSESKASNEALN